MNLIKNKKIAIVGGGPGGLTLARLLQMKGAVVQVFERDMNRNARAQGATLDFHEESGLKALREAGLIKAFTDNYRPGAERISIMDKYARLIFKEKPKTADEIARPEIDRGPLQQILLDSLAPGTVIWNRQCISLGQEQDSWILGFQQGDSAKADIVIAADGARSKIRPYITPIIAIYSGITAVEGAVYHSAKACPKMHQILDGGKIFAMGDDKTVIVSSKGDDSLMFYTSCKMEELWSKNSGIDFSDKRQVLDWFKQVFAGWDPVYFELFENAALPFLPRPIYSMPLDQDWKSLPNLTMLGDAAHLMSPFAGEGVNMAMLDAWELSKYLASEDFPSLQTAIGMYEQEMRQRASEASKQSLDSSIALHSEIAIPYLMNIIGAV